MDDDARRQWPDSDRRQRGIVGATESSGILDISNLVGYKPGSVLLTANQGTDASLTVLINPQAALAADYNGDGAVDAADYVVWRKGLDTTYMQNDYDVWRAQFGQTTLGSGSGSAGGLAIASPSQSAVPEPSTMLIVLGAAAICLFNRCGGQRRNA